MFRTVAFYDLCLQESFFAEGDLEKCIQNLHKLGYRTVAINQTIEDGNLEPKKKKKKGEPRETQDTVPLPYDLSQILAVIKKLNLDDFQVFNRLTIVFSNQDALHKITKSPNYKKFHILAASPTTMQALTYTCGSFEADIFAYNPESKFNLRLNRKFYNQLIQRGYYFELLYSHAIEDSTKRKHLIHASHLYHTFGKSKNVVFSSGAESSAYIRNPYDVISLGFLFGLSELQCKTAVSYCPKQVLLNSVGRRHGKAVMFVDNITEEREIGQDKTVKISDDEDMEIDAQPLQKKSKMLI